MRDEHEQQHDHEHHQHQDHTAMSGHNMHHEHHEMIMTHDDHDTSHTMQHDHAAMTHHHMHMSDDPGMAHMDMTDMARRFWWSLALMVPIIIITPLMGMTFPFTLQFPGDTWITAILATVLYIVGTKPFFVGAKAELKAKRPAMMSLVSLSLLVTFWYSIYALVVNTFWPTVHVMDFFWEFATLTVIMLLGHRIEMAATMEAGDATAKLRALLPNTAHVKHGDHFMDMPVSTLKPDMVVQVLAGEAFPADGVILSGESQVDESLMTGESRLIDKKPGVSVVGGTINGNGTLLVKVTHVGAQSFIGKLQSTLAASQSAKSRVETIADQVASYLFWVALLIAGLSLMIWTPLHGLGFAINIAVTVLVIACPHALGLAVPLVIQRTKAIAATQGILIKNHKALSSANHLTYVLMDKTGTLTTGQFKVMQVVTDNFDQKEALGIMAALDAQSTHPLAQGIVSYAKQQQAPILSATDVENMAGYGIAGMVNDKHYLLVSERYLKDHHIHYTPLVADGTISYLLQHDHVVAAVAQGDEIKATAPTFINYLKTQHLIPILVTGDNAQVAQTVADQLGITEIHAQVSPQEKIALVKDYQKQGQVMMIGDGINDAPALAQADLSVAIGAGTQVAQAAADTVLIANQLPTIIDFLKLAKRADRKQIENLWWGAGYNIIALPLAAGALATFGIMLNPMIGAILMSLSTVIVALNAMTLKA